MPQFFDVHAHVNDKRFDEDRNGVLARMNEHDVWGIMVGTDFKSSQEVVTMASFADGGIFASIGIHPNDVRNEPFRELFFEDLLESKRVVAVGECGLDYSHFADILDVAIEKERQCILFEKQIDFALKHDLPLMLHVRDSDKKLADAHSDVLKILRARKEKEKKGGLLRGNVHFFAQTLGIAREYIDFGFTVSFTGVITFSDEYDDVVRGVPLEFVMSETDCPYVAPVPYRGKRNEPIYVEEVVKKIAELRGEDFETVRAQLVENAMRVFSIAG